TRNRPPSSAGTATLSVTRPMTVPILTQYEIRISKPEIRKKSETRKWTPKFEPFSDFGFRISDFSSYRYSRFFLIHNPRNHPTRRAFVFTHNFARRRTVRRNNYALMHTRAVRINRHLRHALRLAGVIDRLANNEPPPLEARMLPGRDYIAFNTR